MTVVFALTLVFSVVMPAGAFEIGARGLYWLPSFKADIKVDSGGVAGNTIDLKDTLGVKDESFPSFEVFMGHGWHHLNVAYTPIAYSGSTSLSRDITFKGRIYTASSKVDTDLKLRMFDLQYRYTLLDFENLAVGFSFDVIGQVKYIDGEARIRATGMAYSNSYLYEALGDLSLTPFPFLDIHAGYKIIRLKIDQGDVFLNSEFSGPYVGLT